MEGGFNISDILRWGTVCVTHLILFGIRVQTNAVTSKAKGCLGGQNGHLRLFFPPIQTGPLIDINAFYVNLALLLY